MAEISAVRPGVRIFILFLLLMVPCVLAQPVKTPEDLLKDENPPPAADPRMRTIMPYPALA